LDTQKNIQSYKNLVQAFKKKIVYE